MSEAMMQPEIDALAREILATYDARAQMGSICARQPSFDLSQAYAVTGAIRRMREARGETAIGRKLGFTNTKIWDEYGVYAPIWGYVYNTTVDDIAATRRCTFEVAKAVEPRIEPEITLAFKTAPEPRMTDREILECIDWVAHGFEIVQSLFPGWRFAAPDTVAAFGLHCRLMLGPRHRVTAANIDAWANILSTFRVTLFCNGAIADEGSAFNVLGGPLLAIRNVLEVLDDNGDNSQVCAGEIVTTGTLTRAFPVARGQTWSSTFAGAPFEGLTIDMCE